MKPHHETITGNHLLTDEVAFYYRLHPESVRRMIRSKRLHALKIGRNWRVPKTELERIAHEGGI